MFTTPAPAAAAPAAAPATTAAPAATTPPATVPAATVAPATTTGYVNADGSFIDGWHSRDEFKGYSNLERFKDVPTLFKSYYALEQKMSGQQGGVVVPGEGATPEVISAYRKHIGVPEDAKGYVLKPENLPAGLSWDEGRASKMADLFHKQGIPAATAKAIVDHYLADEIATHADLQTRYDNMHAQREQELKNEWGPKYAEKMAMVKGVVQSLGMDPKDPEIFGNPKVLSFMGKMSGLLSEDALASLKVTVGGGGDYSSPAAEARAIQMDVNHPLHARFIAGDREVVQRVSNLFKSSAATE